MRLSEEFLWGGAVAAHQLEGAWREGKKGLSIADVMTAGAHGIPRRITDGVLPGENYPNHRGIDFYHRYPQDIALFAEMGFKCFRTLHLLAPDLSTGRRGGAQRGGPGVLRQAL